MKPRKLAILYEDNHIIVCHKPPQIATECCAIGTPDMVSLIKNHLAQSSSGSREPYLAVIHRLDQPVEGVLVFAKTPFAAKELNRQLTTNGFGKYYRAMVDGRPRETKATLENYLVKNSKTNTSRVCSKDTKGAKPARLHYEIVEEGQGFFNWGRSKTDFTPSQIENALSPTELDIRLDTGRHHQIRVQLAAAGFPIIGDTKYNPNSKDQKKWQNICLCAYKLEFEHPKTHKPLSFQIMQNGTGLFNWGQGKIQLGTEHF